MKFVESFAKAFVKNKTGFYLQYYDMNSFEIPPCYSKKNLQHFIVALWMDNGDEK